MATKLARRLQYFLDGDKTIKTPADLAERLAGCGTASISFLRFEKERFSVSIPAFISLYGGPESQFRTMNNPEFPDRFGRIQDSRAFCQTFFPWYNDEHRHSGIGMMSPAMVHHGAAVTVRENRQLVLDAAYRDHPEHFVRRPLSPPQLP
jgi:hypothetical protein